MTAPGHEQPGLTSATRLTRRQLLVYGSLTGAMAVFAGCTRAPDQHAVPFLEQPEQSTPGVARWYATTCAACPAQCGLMAKVRDGRPIKLEGTPEHPLNRGGLCAIGQASVRGLYDADRLAGPQSGGQALAWGALDERVRSELAKARAAGGVVLVTPTVTGPATTAAVAAFVAAFNARHVVVDAAPSLAAIRAAHRQSHGEARMPDYRFDRARVIVGVEADFLGSWLMPATFARRVADARALDRPGGMARHIQFESAWSLTGSNADVHVTLSPSAVRSMLARLEYEVAAALGQASGEAPATNADAAAIAAAAKDLAAHRGEGMVVCGVNDPVAQLLVNRINHALGNYGSGAGPLDWNGALHLQQGDDAAFAKLVDDAAAGKVGALVLWDVNPVYDHPLGAKFADALGKVAFSVAMTTHADETAAAAKVQAPVPHFLESWGDGQPADTLLTLSQPTLQPLTDCRHGAESLLRWAGQDVPFQQFLKSHWREQIHPRVAGVSVPGNADGELVADLAFGRFWRQSLQRGFVQLPATSASAPAFRETARPAAAAIAAGSDELQLVLTVSPVIGSGRHANNPWLQECSEPLTKLTWDNAALMHPATADSLGVKTDSRVTLTAGEQSATVPVVVVPGMDRHTIAVWLGYGRTAAGQIGNGVGVNVAPLLQLRDGFLSGHAIAVSASRANGSAQLALTQTYGREITPLTGHDRNVVREASFGDWQHDPAAGNHEHHATPNIWPGHEYTGHHWAMIVDLTRCIGCAGCIMACQAENNIPSVGKDEVRRRREMHWMRIDRYFSGGPEDADPAHVSHMPLMCQQCDNAPCETVCPVAATTHSAEGLNEQVYNRCVGTRYCANNCPYKARRFNWFNYDRGDETANLVLNPDVTVRSRGVMEKCTFCVQRINEAKHQARAEGRDLRDGDVAPACAQSCPTRAIVFGDDNAAASAVSNGQKNPRAYHLLEEVNALPSVAYLTKVRHTRGDSTGDGHSADPVGAEHGESTHE